MVDVTFRRVKSAFRGARVKAEPRFLTRAPSTQRGRWQLRLEKHNKSSVQRLLQTLEIAALRTLTLDKAFSAIVVDVVHRDHEVDGANLGLFFGDGTQ